MVSSGTVAGHSSELSQSSGNYMSLVEGLSGGWTGPSHDSLLAKFQEFHAQMQQVINQINSFEEAVALYEQYKEYKDKYISYQSSYNSLANDPDNASLASQYLSYMQECEAKMKELAPKIEAALSAASSFHMEASSGTSSDATIAGADANGTEASTLGHQISTTGGQFQEQLSKGVFGYITSSMDGKTHTVYNQGQIAGWSGDCNRAAASSIASAYASYNGEAVDVAKKSANGIGYKNDVTNAYFNQFGLTATVNKVNGSYDSVKNQIVSNLQQGNYVMFDLSNPTVGKSGQLWTSRRHWLSILDIKQTDSGDYAIFVSDSAHHGSQNDHGLGAGWYSIDEFCGHKIANYTVVKEQEKAVAV